jgi:hypothetical protein
MDFQPSGSKARELFTDAARFFAAQPDGRSAMADLAIAQGIFERLFTAPREFMTASDSSRNTFRSALTRVLARPINPVPDLGPLGDPGFWRQTLAGLMAWADFTWALNPGQPDPAVFNRRDSVMAANLIWLASTRPNRKVIVWGATSHFIRNRTGITDDPAPNMVPTGHLASMALPGETYIIGFLAAEGETGSANPRTRTPRAPVEAPDPMTLDGLGATTGQELGFLDLRELPRGGDWLRRPVTARPQGYLPMTAIWPDHLDGFVFTRRMTPSTPRR